MHNWFECKVKYEKPNEGGKASRVTETFLVDAFTFTDAEARITEKMTEALSCDFLVTAVNKSKLTDILPDNDEPDYWYRCKVVLVDIDEKSGKEKKITNLMLVEASGLKDACERLEQHLSTVIVPWDLTAVTLSPILEIFPYTPPEEAEKEED